MLRAKQNGPPGLGRPRRPYPPLVWPSIPPGHTASFRLSKCGSSTTLPSINLSNPLQPLGTREARWAIESHRSIQTGSGLEEEKTTCFCPFTISERILFPPSRRRREVISLAFQRSVPGATVLHQAQSARKAIPIVGPPIW